MEKYNWTEIFDKIDKGSTYKDIVEEYGMAYATLVRKYKGYEAGRLLALEENSSEDMLIKLEEKRLSVLKEQKKNTILRGLAHQESKKAAIVDIIASGIGEMEFKLPAPKKFVQKAKTVDERQTFVISDLHYVDSERSKSLTKMGQMWLENWNGAKEIFLVFNGDLIENTHHMSQLLDKKSTNPAVQAVEVANIIAEQIQFLCANLPDVVIIVRWTVGNHDEIRQLTKAGESQDSNWVEVVKMIVAKALGSYENYIDNDSAGQTIEDYGHYTYSIRHGHKIKSNRQESIEQFLIKEHIQGGYLFDTYIISHFHQFRHWVMKGSQNQEGNDVEVIMTPSMKDWDGNFEENFNTTNTSGMISIDEERNVKFIRIPED